MILDGQDGKRFVVQAISGYPEGKGSSRLSTSYAVLDRDYCWREVAKFPAAHSGRPLPRTRYERALAVAEQLNEEYA